MGHTCEALARELVSATWRFTRGVVGWATDDDASRLGRHTGAGSDRGVYGNILDDADDCLIGGQGDMMSA